MNYVLGSGLSGLICGFRLKIPVIGDAVGGQFSSELSQGPRYFHESDGMKQLLYDLKTKYTIRTRKVGYYDWTNHCYVKQTEGFSKAYYLKTRGLPKPADQTTAMNDSKIKFNTLEFDYQKFLAKLASGVAVINDKVSSIDLDLSLIRTEHGSEFEFDNLISTLNAKVFYKLIYVVPSKEALDAWAKLFLYLDSSVTDFRYDDVKFNKFDMTYCIGPKGTPSRITNLDNGVQIVEFTGLTEELKLIAKKLVATKFALVEGLEIRKDLDLDDRTRMVNKRLRSMFFLGRYAEWKHSRRIDQGMFDRIANIKERVSDARVVA